MSFQYNRLLAVVLALLLSYCSGHAIGNTFMLSSRLAQQQQQHHHHHQKNKPGSIIVAAAPKKSSGGSLAPILASTLCAAAIMYPIDLVRALQMANAGSVGAKLTTMQLLSKFRAAHGIKGFFTQGLAPELARSTWMRFFKFGLFPIVHMGLHGISESAGNGPQKALAAIVASVPEALSIMPLEIAKISLQLDGANKFNNNMLKAIGSVWREKGLKGMSVGYLGVQYRQAMWSAAYFASIKYFEKGVDAALVRLGGADVKTRMPSMVVLSQLLSGFLAGVFGAAMNTPGDTIRTVLQKKVLGVAGPVGAALPTILGVAREIVQQRGYGALYAGFGFKALHLGGGGALMAFLIPFFRRVLDDAVGKIKANAAAKDAKGKK